MPESHATTCIRRQRLGVGSQVNPALVHFAMANWKLLVPGFPDTRSPLGRSGSTTSRAEQEANACAAAAQSATAVVTENAGRSPPNCFVVDDAASIARMVAQMASGGEIGQEGLVL